MVAPSLLVALAEQSILITEIGRWVLERACLDRHRWQSNRETDELTMSVNVSTQQLMAPAYVASVAAVLFSTDTDPAVVTLEVTETVFAQDSERALVVLSDLKQLGVKLALDDFGTGYSSLTYLKRFPINTVKIDQGFVADMQHDPSSHAIVGAIVELAHKLGITVVAEGVETPEQYAILAAIGCDFCQGYYFAHPMDADHIDTVIQQHVGGEIVHLPALAGSAPPL
jgi:EAL domain-containing protein (putative c-di-GMP-specific phosphodiesterase class I)